MQQITRKEADYLREHYPSAYIVITSKNKSGRSKRYAVEETREVKRFLAEYRDSLSIKEYR